MITITIDDDRDRQALLLALAILALDRPGWDDYLADIAGKFGENGRTLYDEFRRLHADRFAPGALRGNRF